MGEPAARGISQLLRPKHPLATPPFQRSYAWEEKEVVEYWDDLKAALDADGGPIDYFMGLVVIDEAKRIQDGQQRLATTLILYQELWARAKDITKSDEEYDEGVSDNLTAIVSPLNAPKNPVLEVNSAEDQEALLNRVGITADVPESTRRLQAARRCLQTKLSEDLDHRSATGQLARILQWAEFLGDQAYVIELEVPPQAAHKIFETLNTRGVQLTNGDLFKSYLLARCGTNVDPGLNQWDQILKALTDEAGDYEDNLDDFLYHYCGSRYEKASKLNLFRIFTEHVKDKDALTVLGELRASARLYAALIDPFRAAATKEYSDDAKYALQFVNGIKLRQLRYLLLAVLRDYADEAKSAKSKRSRREELIIKIAAWSIRGLVDGRTGGQVAQNLYVATARAFRDGDVKTVSEVRAKFNEKNLFIVNNTLFTDAFERQRFDDVQAKSVLHELERARLGASAAMDLKDDLTLEHVLPKRPAKGTWTHFSPDEREAYRSRLGNLLLLAQPFNSGLGNLEWPDKREAIKKVKDSQTPFTVAALSFKDWDTATIDTRLNQLARAAAKHWSA